MSFTAPRGVIAPILTPFNDDLSIATDLYVDLAKRLFDDGCAGLAPFGTTGEALSVGIDERISAISSLVDGGIEPSRLIPGTGLSNIADTTRLSRACLDFGCSAVMTLPPFYFKGVSNDGLYAYFEQLIATLGVDARIFLYHIPPIAVVGIPPALAKRLHQDFPVQVIGIKDSSGDWGNTQELLGIDDLIVYPGSELPLLDALELGAPGCISATANINAGAIAGVIEAYDKGDLEIAQELLLAVRRFRETVQDYGPIPAQKRLLAIATGDVRWANVRPPLTAMCDGAGRDLTALLQREFDFALSL
jgi:4-hydroxy-tetrahydrodipicolinate synthase